jgi:uncharacterized protein DUF6786
MISVIGFFLAGLQSGGSDYRGDVAFLKAYTPVVELRLGSARLAVAPKWQGRVMTSAITPDGPGFGWMNRDFIAEKKLVPHMNVFGGEDRLWLGPEGGQFSIFFAPGAKFDLAHWQTPPFMDTLPFRTVKQSASSYTCRRAGVLTNYSGDKFHVQVTRTVRLLSPQVAGARLGAPLGRDVKVVAYESENTLRNTGSGAWTDKTGMLSVWILGQFHHSPTTTVVAPYRPGPEDTLGTIVKDDYFGKVPADRLVVGPKAVYFRADGQDRTKIGLNPRRAHDVIGSWDPVAGVLTVIQYTKPAGVTKYVNSAWEIQAHPFAGDCVNSYNDGPPSPRAKPLGPFYELESSSPAAGLAPGASLTHIHRTIHLSGDRTSLDRISHKVFGVGLDDIAGAFKGN